MPDDGGVVAVAAGAEVVHEGKCVEDGLRLLRGVGREGTEAAHVHTLQAEVHLVAELLGTLAPPGTPVAPVPTIPATRPPSAAARATILEAEALEVHEEDGGQLPEDQRLRGIDVVLALRAEPPLLAREPLLTSKLAQALAEAAERCPGGVHDGQRQVHEGVKLCRQVAAAEAADLRAELSLKDVHNDGLVTLQVQRPTLGRGPLLALLAEHLAREVRELHGRLPPADPVQVLVKAVQEVRGKLLRVLLLCTAELIRGLCHSSLEARGPAGAAALLAAPEVAEHCCELPRDVAPRTQAVVWVEVPLDAPGTEEVAHKVRRPGQALQDRVHVAGVPKVLEPHEPRPPGRRAGARGRGIPAGAQVPGLCCAAARVGVGAGGPLGTLGLLHCLAATLNPGARDALAHAAREHVDSVPREALNAGSRGLGALPAVHEHVRGDHVADPQGVGRRAATHALVLAQSAVAAARRRRSGVQSTAAWAELTDLRSTGWCTGGGGPGSRHKALELRKVDLPRKVCARQRPGPRTGPTARLRGIVHEVAVHYLPEALLADARSALPQDVEGSPHRHAVALDVLGERTEHRVVGRVLRSARLAAAKGLGLSVRQRRQGKPHVAQ
mmetsp:Transcript_2588/g.7806  ORF Transcript_2588/g.7806 Transcript_2588/m.7806 type:complete len:612 (-) Transcript_2588:860-2695(-)